MNQPPYPSWQPDPYGVPPGGNRPPSPPYGAPAPYGQPPRHGPSYRQQPAPYGQPRSYGQPESYGQQPYDQPAQPHGQRSYGQPPPFGRPAPPPSDDFPPPPPPHGRQPVRPDEYPPSALPEKPPKKPGRGRIVGIVVAAVVLAGTAGYVYFNGDSASPAEAGDCIKVLSASSTNASIEKIDCDDPAAVFKVAKKLGDNTDKCPNEDLYEKYEQSGGRGADFALCLMLNAKEGDCFGNFRVPDKRARTDCAAAEVKVTKVVAGKADEAACETPSFPLAYPEPATTYCLLRQTQQ
jgi:hypothetical protein